MHDQCRQRLLAEHEHGKGCRHYNYCFLLLCSIHCPTCSKYCHHNNYYVTSWDKGATIQIMQRRWRQDLQRLVWRSWKEWISLLLESWACGHPFKLRKRWPKKKRIEPSLFLSKERTSLLRRRCIKILSQQLDSHVPWEHNSRSRGQLHLDRFFDWSDMERRVQ